MTAASPTQTTRPLNPNQLTAAKLLVLGHSIAAVARALALHPYTVTRWKKNPLFQSELRYQVYLLEPPTPRAAQQGATKTNNPNTPAPN